MSSFILSRSNSSNSTRACTSHSRSISPLNSSSSAERSESYGSNSNSSSGTTIGVRRSTKRSKYQHKVCIKKDCEHKGVYGCMHCTCDGRCGLGHDIGQCGEYREGSRDSCVVEGCPRDDRCNHSRRAVCYNCRRHRVKGKQKQKNYLPAAFKKGSLIKAAENRHYLNSKSALPSVFNSINLVESKGLPGISALGRIGYSEEIESLKNVWIRSQSVPYNRC